MTTLSVPTRAAWRRWLAASHDRTPSGIWLAFKKGEPAKAWLTYDEAVEEALCFGWIDSIIKRVDDETYVRKFTPRRVGSLWSQLNKERVARLIAGGRMTPHGLALVEAARRTGRWAQDPRAVLSFDMPAEFAAALEQNKKARAFFDQLAPSCRKHYLGWIASAKRPETRTRRVQEALTRLTAGRKLGMK
jgi:uncharacterized protein YdeI (YjbR/CyaY-like superfamily)